MSRLRRFASRILHSLRPARAESELSREIDAHLQLLEDTFIAQGMTREDARAAARREFHGVEQTKELQRDARGFRAIAGWKMDLKLGARMLVKSPGLTVIAVIALAVAFGAGATYLEFVNGIVRPRLTFAGGDRLVGIHNRDLTHNHLALHTLDQIRVLRAQLTLVEQVGAYATGIHGEVITPDGLGAPADGVRTTAAAFQVLPAAPLLGRPLVAADEDASAPPVVVVGEAFWRARLQANPDALGRDLTIEHRRYRIVGVMPESFGFPVNHVLWIPLRDDGRRPAQRAAVFGRLRPGVSMDAARAEVEAILQQHPDRERALNQRVEVTPFVRGLGDNGFAGNDQLLLVYAVNFVFVALLLACAANVATLVFGRTITREAEITVRAALGASRGRIVSQLIAEAFVLVALAAVAGLGFTKVLLTWVRPMWEKGNGSEMPFWWNERLDIETLGYTVLLSILAALVIGGLPAIKATGAQMQGRLKQAGAASTMQFGRLWTYVVVFQVALTVLFLSSIVAMGSSFMGIFAEFRNVAFQRDHYVAAMLEVTEGAETSAYLPNDAFLNALRSSPAIQSVTYTTRLPATDQESTYFEVEGQTMPVRVAHIGPDFFETFGRTFVQGRPFATSELVAGANVAIVDESFVRFALGGAPAVGRQVRVKDPNSGELGPYLEIIGVTADMSTSPRKSLRDARLYRPIGAVRGRDMYLVARAREGYRDNGLAAVVTAIRDTSRAMPAGRPLRGIQSLAGGGDGDVIEYVLAGMGIVGAVALLLSTAGVYALISFTLARRTREIGIRTALGASPRRIITGILSRAMWQIAIGVIAGAVPSFLIVGSVASEMGRNGLAEGLLAAGAVSAFVLIVAAISCTVPLRRALGVQPTEALRTT